MKRVVNQIVRGLRTHPEYGPHPGTPFLMILILLGAMAGQWKGALAMAGVFGPMYLYGAYERGR